MKGRLKILMKNELARNVVTFFYSNQGSIDTLSGVSAWVNEGRDETRKILDDLVSVGVLEQDDRGAAKGYCYTRDETLMRTVADLMKAYAKK